MCEQCRSAAAAKAVAQAARAAAVAAAAASASAAAPNAAAATAAPAGNPAARIGSVRPAATAGASAGPIAGAGLQGAPAAGAAAAAQAATPAAAAAAAADKHVIQITLDIDPANEASADDKITLRSSDGTVVVTKTVKDDTTPGDKKTTLKFQIADASKTYSIEVDPGAEGEPYCVLDGYRPAA